jgi:peptide/nickel transport system ATP-binding protein
MALLEVDNLVVDIRLGDGILHAVSGVSFSLERGETLAIVGESGSGKSMTSLALMNLLPTRAERRAGRLAFDGIDLVKAPEARMRSLRGNRMAMIFQEPMTSLNPSYTIGNQLTEALRCHRAVSGTDARDRAVHLLEKVGIPSAVRRLNQYPHQLSGGLRQRVMIAMALMCGPDLIIADEPTTALDVTIQAQILELLNELKAKLGMAVLLITHDMGVIAETAQRVMVMYAGKVVEEASVKELFKEPLHPYTQGLLRSIPRIDTAATGTPLGAIPGQLPTLIGPQRGCAFRDRCAFAAAECAGDIPFVATEPGHRARCVRTEALEAVA